MLERAIHVLFSVIYFSVLPYVSIGVDPSTAAASSSSAGAVTGWFESGMADASRVSAPTSCHVTAVAFDPMRELIWAGTNDVRCVQHK